MGKLQDCLSTLSIIATSNIFEDSHAQATAAVGDYLNSISDNRAARLAALDELQNGLRQLKLDSTSGAIIWRIIEDCRVEVEASSSDMEITR